MPRRSHNEIAGPGLWRAGFTLQALPAIRFMSGLVDIVDVVYESGGVHFYVRSKDATRTIFKKGFLRGTPVKKIVPSPQPLLTTAPVGYTFEPARN